MGESRLANSAANDDSIIPFSTVKSRALGRLVRLGPVVDRILSQHDYPLAVSEVLGQAVALTTMLGTTLKFDGNLIVQTKTDGPLGMLVVNFETPGRVRAHASFDSDQLATVAEQNDPDHGDLLGSGYLAITIDPGKGMERYQGVVALEGRGLADAALNYFRQSEQLPTFVRLAVARYQSREIKDDRRGWMWRAGGLLVQHVAPIGGVEHNDDEADFLLGEDDDNWRRVALLAQTVEDHEMLDPLLAPEHLLYRLFHEEGVRAAEPRELQNFCRCSQKRVETMLQSFKSEELSDLRDEAGDVVVTCEFCNRSYRYSIDEAI
ncbi:MAG: Hsp33 family molecular chaperone [Hyphomicrobiaceae bacterium]